MTLYEFNILELNERMEAVNQYDIYLDNYTEDIRINCYAIDKFFVEVVNAMYSLLSYFEILHLK